MWVFTRHGFYSVVAYDPSKDKEKNSPFKRLAKNKFTHVLVRARVKEDLERLRPTIPGIKVVDDVIADYKYRAVVRRSQWKKVLNTAVDDITYDSHFKEVMRDGDPLQGAARYRSVMKVWSAMIELQPFGAWEGNWTSTYKGGKTTGGAYSDDNWDLDQWFKDRAKEDTGYPNDSKDETAEVPTAPDDSDEPLTILDVKRFILEAVDKPKEYPDFLSENEVSRTTEDGFELWVRVMELRKTLGKANLLIDEGLLDAMIAEIQAANVAEVTTVSIEEEETLA